MYAVLKTGGKQYRVVADDQITVEKLDGEEGQTIVLDTVLMVGEEGKLPKIGTPVLPGVTVEAEIVSQFRAAKVLSLKKQQRSTYRRLKGHRQSLTELKILGISESGAKTKAASASKGEEVPAEKVEKKVASATVKKSVATSEKADGEE